MRMFILSQALVYDLIRFFLCVFEKMWPIKGTCVNRSRPECDPYVQKNPKGAARCQQDVYGSKEEEQVGCKHGVQRCEYLQFHVYVVQWEQGNVSVDDNVERNEEKESYQYSFSWSNACYQFPSDFCPVCWRVTVMTLD